MNRIKKSQWKQTDWTANEDAGELTTSGKLLSWKAAIVALNALCGSETLDNHRKLRSSKIPVIDITILMLSALISPPLWEKKKKLFSFALLHKHVCSLAGLEDWYISLVSKPFQTEGMETPSATYSWQSSAVVCVCVCVCVYSFMLVHFNTYVHSSHIFPLSRQVHSHSSCIKLFLLENMLRDGLSVFS